jgi:hypothetical protein
MWTKILIFMVVFFLVANPSTFKIVRRLLGSWVASAEGLATPAGLVLHGAVFVGLAIFLPKALMGASGYAEDDEEFEDEGEEFEDEGEEFEDEGEEFRRSKKSSRPRCGRGQYYNKSSATCMAKPTCGSDEYFSRRSGACKQRRRSKSTPAASAVTAPGAAPLTMASKYEEEDEEFIGMGPY